MSASASPGFHGKVPGLGDFVTRRLPRAFIDYWDSWLQTVVAASKVQLGEGWLATYLSSPLWRFALSAGHCGAQPWVGVLMPSCDRVGRYFPLTIATSLSAAANPFIAVAAAAQWFEDAEAMALSALEADDFDMEEFNAGVEALGPCPEAVSTSAAVAGDAANRAGLQVSLAGADRVADGYGSLLKQLMQDGPGVFSVWSTDGSDLVEPSLLVCEGLPAEHAYAALLDGQWSQWSWGRLPGQSAPGGQAAEVAE